MMMHDDDDDRRSGGKRGGGGGGRGEKRKKKSRFYSIAEAAVNHVPAAWAGPHVSASPTPQHVSAPRSSRSQRRTSHSRDLNPLADAKGEPQIRADLSIHPSTNQPIDRFARV